MQIARFGYEPKRGIKNEESDESDSDSDNDSENSNRAKSKYFYIHNKKIFLVARISVNLCLMLPVSLIELRQSNYLRL